MTSISEIFRAGKMRALLLLGFSSGLPLGLTGGNLAAWMKDREVDLATIGYFQLVAAPYVLKFLWAPAMDRFVPPLLGRRRGWLIVTQVALVMTIVALALAGGSPSLHAVALLAVAVSFCSASQDIVADAYRTDVLSVEERGYGAAVFVTGYRIAMVTAGAGALYLVGEGFVSWSTSYLLLAGAMGVGMVGTLIAPEPPGVTTPASLYESVVPPFKQFLARGAGWWVLAFVLVFRLPDAIAGAMTIPFLRDIGVSTSQIGVLRYGLGLGVTIVGTLLGGLMVNKLGMIRTMWIVAVLQALSNVGFLWLAVSGNGLTRLIIVMVVENLCAGLTIAGFFAFLMAQCDRRYSATQYALLSSLMAVGGMVIGSQTGVLAKQVGWTQFFLLSIVAAVPGFLILLKVRSGIAIETSDDAAGNSLRQQRETRIE